MTDDAKEWVTIKVPERVRDAAREDPRTYGDLIREGMGEDPAPVAHVEPDLSLDVDTVAKALNQSLAGVDAELPDGLRDQLDRIERAATTAEERTGAIEKTLEEMGAGK